MISDESRLATPEAAPTPPPSDAKPQKQSRSAPAPQIVNSRFIHTASSNSSAAYLPYTTPMSRAKRSSALEVYEQMQRILLAPDFIGKKKDATSDKSDNGIQIDHDVTMGNLTEKTIVPEPTENPMKEQPFENTESIETRNEDLRPIDQNTGSEKMAQNSTTEQGPVPQMEPLHADSSITQNESNQPELAQTSELPQTSPTPNKSTINLSTNQIPCYNVADLDSDPISMVENLASEGKHHGAIKVKMDQDYIDAFAKHRQLDPDTFTFKANKILINPAENEINDRLKFYHDLINFHLNERPDEKPSETPEAKPSPVKEEQNSAEEIPKAGEELQGEAPKAEVPKEGESKEVEKESGEKEPEVKIEPGENKPEPKANEPSKKTRLPVFLTKLPMMDKRPLDLYDLFRLVNRKGGFSEVINKKWWAQIGRELGYKGKITSSLSSSLKMSYSKILYPLELHHAKIAQNAMETSEKPLESPAKRRKLNDSVPLLLGSNAEFRRSVKLKSSKGLLLNDPHLMDLKTPLVISVKDPTENDPKKDRLITPIGAPAQINSYLKWLATFSPVLQDSSRLECDSKMATTYSLRQYLEKDLKFQEYLIAEFPQHFEPGFDPQDLKSDKLGEIRKIDDESFEEIFWSYLEHHSAEFDKLENCPKLQSTFCSPRFEDLSESEIKDPLRAALHPFHLPNIPYLPNSLLGASAASAVDNRDLLSSSFNIGMTFSTENWKCEDHFLQSCSYHFFGKSKRWFFIPESDFDKFEALIAEVVAQNAAKSLVNVNYNTANWDYQTLMKSMNSDDETTNTQYECILNSLENVVNPFPEQRVSCGDELFQKLIDRTPKSPKMNQEFLITPQLLAEKGIRFTTTIQRPGEMILKYPKTYSCAISLGFNMTEEVNFASQLWLDYALDGEKWLQKQAMLPNLSLFKILINFAQLYESSEDNNLYFSSEMYAKVSDSLSDLVEEELDLRSRVRRKVKVREVNIEERHIPDADTISDDDLSAAFPSKIVIASSKNGSNFVMSLSNFEKYIDDMEEAKKAKDNDFPDLVKNSNYTFELHLLYSDEKLKTYQRSLKSYTADYESWMRKYDETFKTEDDASLKTYRSLLSEGQKICSALSDIKDSFSEFCSGKAKTEGNEAESVRMAEFKQRVKGLRDFVSECTEVIEQCQSILALKHQQRIRNGATESERQEDEHSRDSLHILVDLVNKIPRLNFYTPEFDQIHEYKSEIFNFDKACRQLIKSKNAQLSDMNDMISLGTSFGIQIPSLSFLIRLRDRVLWIKTHETIVAGGDPFVGKKEIFSIFDLKAFRDKGLKVLSSDDQAKLQEIEHLVATGEEYDAKVRSYLSQNQVLNHVDLKELDKIIIDMEDRSKLKGPDRLFVDLDTYQGLVDLKGQEKRIQFLQSFSTSSHNLFDTKQFLADLESCKYTLQKDEIEAAVTRTEEWLARTEAVLEKVRATKRGPKSALPKQACSTKFVEKAQTILARAEVNFANPTVDVFEASSPYMFAKDLQDDYSEQLVIRYCICRDLEEGVMIECDKCHEWYHVNCVKDLSVIGNEDDKYTCPACLVLDNFRKTGEVSVTDKLTDRALVQLVQEGQSLHVKPSVELDLLKELHQAVEEAVSWYRQDETKSQMATKGPLFTNFLYRKFIGSPLFVGEVAGGILRQLKDEKSPFEREFTEQQKPEPQTESKNQVLEKPQEKIESSEVEESEEVEKPQVELESQVEQKSQEEEKIQEVKNDTTGVDSMEIDALTGLNNAEEVNVVEDKKPESDPKTEEAAGQDQISPETSSVQDLPIAQSNSEEPTELPRTEEPIVAEASNPEIAEVQTAPAQQSYTETGRSVELPSDAIQKTEVQVSENVDRVQPQPLPETTPVQSFPEVKHFDLPEVTGEHDKKEEAEVKADVPEMNQPETVPDASNFFAQAQVPKPNSNGDSNYDPSFF